MRDATVAGDGSLRRYGTAIRRSPKLLLFRTLGYLACALLAALWPEVGPHRLLLAGLLVFVAVPAIVLFRFAVPATANGWLEPLCDLLMVVTMVHLVPDAWFPALCVGLMVALAPSVGLHERSYVIHGLLLALLVAGMALAALVHQPSGWVLPLLAVALVSPSIVYYSSLQARRAGELRRRADRLSSLTQVAGSVAHDFNNQLAGISGQAELALLELPAGHPARAPLREVLKSVRRAGLMSRQLASFSGRDLQAEQELDLVRVVDTVVDLLQPTLRPDARIRWDGVPDRVRVKGDEGQLQEVLMNVLINAVEASDDAPRIELRLLRLDTLDGPRAELAIRDHGRGLPEQAVERAFDPFFTTKPRDHGLGLASSRRIMAAHGGDIRLGRAPGQGTTVTLQLPAVPDSPAEPAPAAEGLLRETGRILVVDDEAGVREAAGGLLEALGYEVELAASADEAVARFARRQGAYDAVLLDLKMPGKDGWTCLTELRALRMDVPVIVCSGYNPGDGSGTPADDAALVYLSKPFRLADLQRALGQLSRRRLLRRDRDPRAPDRS